MTGGEWNAIWAAAGAVVAAAVSGLAVYFTQRSKTGVESFGVINEAFTKLVKSLSDEIERQKTKQAEMILEMQKLHEELDTLRETVHHLEEFIEAKGLIPPEVKKEL